ncbi:hypothetical protein ASE16_03530 [Leifsonia sp. Root227]|uniref:Gp19/Gp15/Gp42 family protein n=1 Tax=Leifsonia sp. Root227 TaxID=1736496 RepID=UPI0006FE6810|nr:Gp19/Gp15/Gp42 family protein [Leifsonia sp. Root227]KRC52132.1 hypothetical protein ASE16_03530 [Leifsonia sp. Root227]
MAINPASSDDLVSRSLRTLSAQEISVGATLLGDAWTILNTEIPTIAARVDVDIAFSNLVVQVECAMVLRVLNNPNGKLEEAVDDYSVRFDSAVSSGALYLTEVERDLLGRGDSVSDAAFTIRAVPEPFSAPSNQWWPWGLG